MASELQKESLEVPPAEDQQVVEALPACRPHPPFGERVRLRGPEGGADDPNAFGPEDLVERTGELGVPVSDQEPDALKSVELLKQASWLEGIAGIGHWRTHDGDEVDLVVERDDGAVVAFEVKTSARVPGSDMRSLRKLREAVGDAFMAGVALYTGTRSYAYEDRLFVLPVDRIWNPI
jgi:hypothetical protein